jgi:hypothetical protein
MPLRAVGTRTAPARRASSQVRITASTLSTNPWYLRSARRGSAHGCWEPRSWPRYGRRVIMVCDSVRPFRVTVQGGP